MEGMCILLGKQEENGILCGGWKQLQGKAIRYRQAGGELAGPPLIALGNLLKPALAICRHLRRICRPLLKAPLHPKTSK